MNRNLKQEYENMIHNNRIMVFIKGTPQEPKCGFTKAVVQILNTLEVKYDYYNILEDPQMREAIKEFANWPTYPQLYVNSELIGGAQIIIELFNSGELKEIIK